jgi:protein-S-isoprenylcysteine O-methyltransferase Ste14
MLFEDPDPSTIMVQLLIWMFFMMVWASAWLRSSIAVRTAHPWLDRLHLILVGTGVMLIVLSPLRWLPYQWLFSQSFLPNINMVTNIGAGITAAGMMLAIWARFILGRQWNTTISIQENHELIRRGPYKVVRHPIYTGVLLAALGSVLALHTVGAAIGLLLLFITYAAKISREDRWLVKELGESYAEYRREVAAMVPWLY